MSQVIWLPEALEDAERLFVFLEDKNPAAATRAAQALQGGTKLLSDFPEIGCPMNDHTERRELFIPFGSGAYVLRYIIDDNTVVIIRAWHSKEERH